MLRRAYIELHIAVVLFGLTAVLGELLTLSAMPRPNVSSSYIFAKEDKFFLYPNNYNHYHNYYKDTFQHGGISLEEMICPVVRLKSKG